MCICTFLICFFFFLPVFPDVEELQFNASPEEFTSKKITTKILQQIEVSFFSRIINENVLNVCEINL